MCKCNLVTCQVGEWGTWQGDISADSCGTQTRSKAVSSTHAHKYQENTCEGLATTCPDTPTESRKMCNCSYREDCSLLEWQGWQGDIPESGCARQIRHREYNNSIIYVQRDTCDGLTSCPVIKDETRTKCNCNKIICEWSNWFRESFDQETNCWTEMRVKNASSGFEKVVQMDNCNAIPSMCDMGLVERQKDFVPATFVQVGCFNDDQGSSKRKGVRPLPHLFKNLRDQITDWFNFDHILQGCANEARNLRQETSGRRIHSTLSSFYRQETSGRRIHINTQFLLQTKNLRYEYFGVQFFAECWGGKDPEGNEAYARDGLAAESKCWKGVGGQRTNMVYRVQDMPGCSDELDFTSSVSSGVGLKGKMPDRCSDELDFTSSVSSGVGLEGKMPDRCSDELDFTSSVSSGAVTRNHAVWCADQADQNQWITVDLKNPVKISGVGTQGGTKDSWVTLYSVEYSEEGEAWVPYKEETETAKTFAGNSDQFTLELYWLKQPLNARFLRFKPISWSSSDICMKIRVYGCT
ncbi:predicted protein [Nematostella vectensis]|uniref:F5/8 type C domain-containing protein n=1 Tax=Nematostella vectensis TaxID=45351 RepID=A7S8T3_NEMVE|nr:predicted protein [Nematostella vectensis]|eukprot:XP_001631985.1 predicted protein [Nematostella vectensis]